MSTQPQSVTYYVQTVATSTTTGIEVYKSGTKYIAHVDWGHTNPSNTIIKKQTVWPKETVGVWLIENGYTVPNNPPGP